MKRVYLLIFIQSLILCVYGQDMQVESMNYIPLDLSASTNVRNDFNGQPCGLVKVAMTVSNATFGGSVIGEVLRDGSDYWVYLTDGTKMLQIKHPNYKTLMVNFPNFGIDHIEGKKTYILSINLPYYEVTQITIPDNKETNNENDIITYTPKVFKPKKIKDYEKAFFPVFGIMPGETTPEEAIKLGYKPENTILKLQDSHIGMIGRNHHDRYNHIQISRIKDNKQPKMPKKWADDFGFDISLSYNEWISLFNSLGFRIDVEKEPTVEEYNGRNILKGEFRATEPGGKFYFSLIFGSSDEDNSSVYSPNTLSVLNLIYVYNPEIESKVLKTKEINKNPKLSPALDTFFPIYGASLGRSTWYDMSKAGFELSFYDSGACFAQVLSLNFADYDEKGYFDRVLFIASHMPAEWSKLGFQKDNSYETWIQLLDDMGYTIVVEEEPSVETYDGREVLKAKFSAISEDAHFKIEFDFDYGKNGSDISSPGTLYDIQMIAQ